MANNYTLYSTARRSRASSSVVEACALLRCCKDEVRVHGMKLEWHTPNLWRTPNLSVHIFITPIMTLSGQTSSNFIKTFIFFYKNSCVGLYSLSLKYNQQDATLSRSIYFYKLLYMFQAVTPPIIRSTKLYIQRQVLSNQYCCLLLSWMRWNVVPSQPR